MSKLVSIIVPSYNHESYITTCLESLIDQTYENIELIIIDDGSKDNSKQVIKSFENKLKNRFVNYIFIEQENSGICKTLNKGLKIVNGEYFQIVSSDDFIDENYIKKQVEYMNLHPEFMCSYTDTYQAYFDDNGILDKEKTTLFSDKIEFLEGDLSAFMRKNVFKVPSPAFIYRIELFEQIGMYDENLSFEDIDMLLRIAHQSKIGSIKEPLYYHRIHGYNTGKNISVLFKGISQLAEKYKTSNIMSESHKKEILDLFESHLTQYEAALNRRNFFDNSNYEKKINGRELVIWGTGSFADQIVKSYPNLKIAFYIDSNPNKKQFDNCEVQLPEKLLNKKENYFVYIASSFFNEIKVELEKLGYIRGTDFL